MKAGICKKDCTFLFVRCNPLYVSLIKGYAKTKNLLAVFFVLFPLKSVSKKYFECPLISENRCLEQERERRAVFQILYGISCIDLSVGQREFLDLGLGLKSIFFKSSQKRLGVRVDSK